MKTTTKRKRERHNKINRSLAYNQFPLVHFLRAPLHNRAMHAILHSQQLVIGRQHRGMARERWESERVATHMRKRETEGKEAQRKTNSTYQE